MRRPGRPRHAAPGPGQGPGGRGEGRGRRPGQGTQSLPAAPPMQRPGGHGKHRSDGPAKSGSQAGRPISPTAPDKQQATDHRRRRGSSSGQQPPSTRRTDRRRGWNPSAGPVQSLPEAGGRPAARYAPGTRPAQLWGAAVVTMQPRCIVLGQLPTTPDVRGVGDQRPLDRDPHLLLPLGGVDQRHEHLAATLPGGDQGPFRLPSDPVLVDVHDAAQRDAVAVHHGPVPPAARRLHRRSGHRPHRSPSGWSTSTCSLRTGSETCS